jgi:hypothetical protein
MKKNNNLSLLLILIVCLIASSCSGGKPKATKIEEYVKPIAEFMSSTSGVQLFSYFGTDAYKKEKVTLEANICSQGGFGKNPAIFSCKFEVNGVTFEPVILVSEEEKEKVKETLKKVEVESKGEKEDIIVVFEGILVKEGSNKSPFGGEIALKFEEGKVLHIEE